MESAPVSEMELDVAKILFAGSTRGHRFELLECRDGSFAITCDGTKQLVFQGGRCNLELCTRNYLAVLSAFAEGLPGSFLSPPNDA
ncbi:MAG TPA: hypothetical protein VFE47_22485 [Tepidisphaeraceae bacterium]|jgi:hypothetical protein|nr:hypothetical protein [Tepidisphaeraceae bacterium]